LPRARRRVIRSGPITSRFNYHQEGGDVDKAFAEAEVVVKQRITSQRLIPAAMETAA
jgi:carbon-monoxide dehydrogenase large subunit